MDQQRRRATGAPTADTAHGRETSARAIRRVVHVGAADDRAELEADAIAERVVRNLGAGAPGSTSSRTSSRTVQRATGAASAAIGAEGGELDSGTACELASARRGGRPLEDSTRSRMEGAFGADFGRIRVHTDARADRLSREISADAFTTGRDVFFRSGGYRPGSADGDRMLAHELAHTVQQGAATSGRVRRSTVQPGTVQRLFGNNRKKRLKKNTYPEIEAVVAKAQHGTATTNELIEAQAAVRRHQRTASKMNAADDQLATLRYLMDELNFGLDRLNVNATKQLATQQYGDNARAGKLNALSQAGAMYFQPGWQHTAVGKDHGLTDAESAAITTYTADDYKYINPAAANSSGWMKSQMKNDMQRGTEQERLQEGAMHAGVMMQALAKLPAWQGPGFRGERLSPEQFGAQFDDDGTTVRAKDATVTKTAFWSISIDQTKSARIRERCAELAERRSDRVGDVLHRRHQRPQHHGLLRCEDGEGSARPGRVAVPDHAGRAARQRPPRPSEGDGLVPGLHAPDEVIVATLLARTVSRPDGGGRSSQRHTHDRSSPHHPPSVRTEVPGDAMIRAVRLGAEGASPEGVPAARPHQRTRSRNGALTRSGRPADR